MAKAYPFFVPVFFVFYNLQEIDFFASAFDVFTILFGLIALQLGVLLIGKAILTKWGDAHILLFTTTLFFLFYSDLYYWVQTVISIRHIYLVFILLLAITTTIIVSKKFKSNTKLQIHKYIGIFVFFALITQATITSINWLKPRAWINYISLNDRNLLPKQNHSTNQNIYYILLDAYAGDSVLLDKFNYKNQLSTVLRKKGYQIWPSSRSLYNSTLYSMTSTFSFDSIQTLNSKVPHELARITIHRVHLNASPLAKKLLRNGYEIHNLSFFDFAGYPPNSIFEYLRLHGFSFWRYCKHKTLWGKISQDLMHSTMSANRLKQLSSEFKSIDKKQKGLFVYVHALSPHPPYYYGPNGEFYPSGAGKKGNKLWQSYLDQLQYTNKWVLDIVEDIHSNDTHPVVIIQSDHGPSISDLESYTEEDSYKNYTAIYFPDSVSIPEDQRMSNTWPYVFSQDIFSNVSD